MISPINILKGTLNLVFKDEEVEELALERATICLTNNDGKKCVHLEEIAMIGKVCGKCGCPIATKSRATDEMCPINMW